MTDGCADMWAAALEYAFRAACEPLCPTIKKDTGGGCTPSEAADEWRFLTATKGAWAESRAIICGVNGVDPDIVRAEALRRGISRQAKYGLLTGAARAGMLREMGERDQRMMADYAAGLPINDIAAAYGITDRRIKQIAADYGVKRRHTTAVQLTPQQRAERNAALCADYQAGVATDELAEKYRLTRKSVHSLVARQGVRRPAGFVAQLCGEASRTAAEERYSARNAEIMDRTRRGETARQVAVAMGMRIPAVESVIRKMRKAASNASGGVLGGACVAGGGGVVGGASFHAQSMEESSR